jgi:hypothetical protein
MMNSNLLMNNTFRRTAVALMMLVLLLLPLQAEAIGHESRLVLSGIESEESAAISGRIESPDMVLARTSAESSAASSLARVESPDMLMARVAAEGVGAVTPPFVDTAVSGVNVWALVVLLVLAIGLAGILVLWEGMFPIKERDVERVTNRCALVGEGC